MIFTYGHNYLAAKAMHSKEMQEGMVDAMYGERQNRPGLRRYWQESQDWEAKHFFSELFRDVNRKLEQASSELGSG